MSTVVTSSGSGGGAGDPPDGGPVPGDDRDESGVPPTRRRHTALLCAVAVACVMAMFVAVLATRTSAQDKQSRSPLLGKPAPASTVGTDLGGQTVRLSDLGGRFVVVNFFASWCESCLVEHPELVRFAASHKSAGDAAVLGVIFSDDAAHARAFVKTNGGDWPIIDDPGGMIALDYGVQGPPESFLVGPDGIVLAKIIGRVSASGLDRLILQAEGKAR